MQMSRKVFSCYCLMSIILISSCIMNQKVVDNKFPDPAVEFNFLNDSIEQKTILEIIPYGNVVIPGSWEHHSYLSTLHQQFFVNEDSTYIGIAKNPINRYPFFEVKQTSKEFLVEYYKWDVIYWQQKGMETRLFRNRTDSGYVIWMARDPQTSIYSVLLYGIKDTFAYNLSIASNKLTDDEMANFLIELYSGN